MSADDARSGPAPGATGGEPKRRVPARHSSDGEAIKQYQLWLFEQNRAKCLRKARAIALRLFRQKGVLTIEDVRAEMDIPGELDPRWLGAVLPIFGRKGIARIRDYVKAQPPQAHARMIGRWELVREPTPEEIERILGREEPPGPRPDRADAPDADDMPPLTRPRGDSGAAAAEASPPSRRDPAPCRSRFGPLFDGMQSPARRPSDFSGDRAGRG